MAWSAKQRAGYERYTFQVRQYAELHGMSFQEAKSNYGLKYWQAVLKEQSKALERGEEVDVSPEGEYSEALNQLGYRKGFEWWNVGETDKIRKRSERFKR